MSTQLLDARQRAKSDPTPLEVASPIGNHGVAHGTNPRLPRHRLRILGIRGVPAQHGGFETFAEHLSLHLVERGWEVFVYCQSEGSGEIVEDEWRGVRRVHIPSSSGSTGSIGFDWRSVRHAVAQGDLCLTLGYNTAVFCGRLRMAGIRNVINMDGIEWARGKWGLASRLWFYLNDWAGCWLGDRLVADHPEILKHLASRGVRARTTMIPYGAHELGDADPSPLARYGLEPGKYFLVIARPEPENSILEIVRGYGASARDRPLVVLGNFDDGNSYHRSVKAAAVPGVKLLGAIYDRQTVAAMRVHATAYIHGHRVGGTNPSLVEALGAGSAVIAQDNRFNRWVAGPSAMYFADAAGCAMRLDELIADPARLSEMREASRARFHEQFTLDLVHARYEALLHSVVTA
jgi:glycosyltransferase involved in cell wall biosynthesis